MDPGGVKEKSYGYICVVVRNVFCGACLVSSRRQADAMRQHEQLEADRQL